MGYHQPSGYAIAFGCAVSDPADSTQYYIPQQMSLALVTTINSSRVIIPERGRITKIALWIYNSNQNCSAEDTIITIRLNNTTDYAAYTGTFASGMLNVINLNVPVNIGDYVNIGLLTPAWVTNPLGTILVGNIFIETI